MSTTYTTTGPIAFDELKGLDAAGVKEIIVEGTCPNAICLTDGENFLWAAKEDDGRAWFERTGANDVEGIISALEKHFSERICEIE